jgi:hypothetical protein
MSQRISGVLSLVLFFLVAETFPVQAQSSDAKALLDEAAKAMGGTQALRLPRAKILIEADHARPRKNQIRPGPYPNALLQGIEKLKLDVGIIAGIHGDTGDMQGLRAAVAKGGQR